MQRIVIFIIVLCWYFAVFPLEGSEITLTDLRCEYLKNPLGIDTFKPRFSWIMQSEERGVGQTGYEILVASSRRLLADDTGDMWKSGLVQSAKPVNIEYAGEPLDSDEVYYWKVRIRDQDGVLSSWSQAAMFQMGLLSGDDWQGRWIGAEDLGNRAPLLRKKFILPKEVAHAYAYVTGLGFYQFYLNGEKVGDHALDPAMTEYRRRVLYATFDVTNYLQQGANAAGFLLGEGMAAITLRDSTRHFNRAKEYPGTYDSPRAVLQLNITFADGSTQSIVTDTSWKTSRSPLVYHHFFGGEDYDARLGQPGWTQPGFDDRDWTPAVIKSEPGALRSQLIPPMRVMQTLNPVRSTNPEPGIHVFDLGQNIGGWWRIHVQGSRGVTLKIRGAETLDNEVFPKPLSDTSTISLNRRHGAGGYYHRDCLNYYTLKGDGLEIYEPHFFYTGFRYIQVETDPDVTLDQLEVEGRLVYSGVEPAGDFSCSNQLLNTIHQNTVWSIKDILQSIPGSNPHSEKYGWTGDAHLFAEHANYNLHLARFWLKWLNDLRDAQAIVGHGRVPDTVPNYRIRKGAATPAWGAVYPILLWYVYQYYEDERALKEHYPGIKAWCDYLTYTAEDGIVSWGRGDHKAVSVNEDGEPMSGIGSTGEIVPLTSTAYYYNSAKIVAQVAKILGYENDYRTYASLANRISRAFHREFFKQEGHYYTTSVQPEQYFSLQTNNLIALDFGLVPDEEQDDVLRKVKEDIMETHHGHLTTGILGTKSLVKVLPNQGCSDVMYHLATQTAYPSWGYWVTRGATTLWQDWTGWDDHNHAMFGPVDEFLFNHLAGIKSPTDKGTTVGFRQVAIYPYLPADLSQVEAWISSVRGNIRSAWQKEDNSLIFRITIPANVEGIVTLPAGKTDDIIIRESGTVVWKNGAFLNRVAGLQAAVRTEQGVKFTVSSGRYTFTLL